MGARSGGPHFDALRFEQAQPEQGLADQHRNRLASARPAAQQLQRLAGDEAELTETPQRHGPGGREPIAVLIGETLFGLRLLEAQCIEVRPA